MCLKKLALDAGVVGPSVSSSNRFWIWIFVLQASLVVKHEQSWRHPYIRAGGPCPSLGTCLPHCLALAVQGIVLIVVVGVVPHLPTPSTGVGSRVLCIFSPTVLFIFIILKNNYWTLFASRKFYSVERAGLELLSGLLSVSLVLGLLSWPPPACPGMGFYYNYYY